MRPSSHSHADTVLDAVRSPSRAAASEIAASWRRSAIGHGLDPDGPARRERLDHAALTALRAEHGVMLAVAAPVLDLLHRSVRRAGCAVILSDAHGVILERRADAADVAAFARAGLVEGARWSEAAEGTNGIGTCLFEGKPVVIHRSQHFASRNVGISCMDAPVHDPHGRLLAALDVSSCRDDDSPAMAEMVAALVREAGRRLERDLFCHHFRENRIVLLADESASGTALLAMDRDDLVVGASRAARLRLGLDEAALASPRALDQLPGRPPLPSFEDADRAVLRQALSHAGGNVTRAARLLGIGRATLYRRMARAALRP